MGCRRDKNAVRRTAIAVTYIGILSIYVCHAIASKPNRMQRSQRPTVRGIVATSTANSGRANDSGRLKHFPDRRRELDIVESVTDGHRTGHHNAADDFFPRIDYTHSEVGHTNVAGKGKGKGSSSKGKGKGSGSKSSSGKGKGGTSLHSPSSQGSSAASSKGTKSPGSSAPAMPGHKTSKAATSRGTAGSTDHKPTPATHSPTVEPTRMASEDMAPMTRPPIDMPVVTPAPSQQITPPPVAPPTPAPSPVTDSPTGAPAGQVSINLTPFGVQYTVTEDRVPFRSEYLEAIELTRMYLEGYFNDQFDDTSMAALMSFSTVFTGSSFDFGQPILIEYESTAAFDGNSAIIPSQQVLDRTLDDAFTGVAANGFVGLLQNLDASNVFSSTVAVDKTEASLDTLSVPQSRGNPTAAAASGVAGAAVLALLVSGFVLSRRRRKVLENKLKTAQTKSAEDTVMETSTVVCSVEDDAFGTRIVSRGTTDDALPGSSSDTLGGSRDHEVTVVFEQGDIDSRSGDRSPSERGDDDSSSYHFEQSEILSMFREDEIQNFAAERNQQFQCM